METSLSRVQLRLVAASYAVVAVVSALLVSRRYLQYVRNPQDVAAAGGMLQVAIFCLNSLPETASSASQ